MPATSAIPTQQVISDQLITAALWNGEFQNIFNLMTPAGVDTYSDTDAKMQLQINPYPGSVTSHATSMAGELERIRYQIALLINGGTDFWYKLPTSSVNTLTNISVPLGGIIEYPLVTPPNANFLPADGRAISRTTYATLYALISGTFGGGDGVTTFNLPDYRDRMSIGAGSTYVADSQGGEATHVLTTNEMPVHNHDASSVVTDPLHQHAKSSTGNINVDNSGSTRVDIYGTNAADTNSTTSQNATGISVATTTSNKGGGAAHNNLPPYLGMFKMMRVL